MTHSESGSDNEVTSPTPLYRSTSSRKPKSNQQKKARRSHDNLSGNEVLENRTRISHSLSTVQKEISSVSLLFSLYVKISMAYTEQAKQDKLQATIARLEKENLKLRRKVNDQDAGKSFLYLHPYVWADSDYSLQILEQLG
jgi:hypothetical protein